VAAIWLVHQFLKQSGTNWREFLGFTGSHLARAILLAIVVGILVLPVVLALNDGLTWWMNSLGAKPAPQPAIKVLESTEGLGQRICFAVAAILLAPLAEEALFRGILYPFVKQLGYPRLAIWGTSLLFGAIHLSLTAFLPLTFFAVVLVLVYERTDKLLAPITIHVLFNVVNFFGAIFGPELDRLLHHLPHR
jgi:membrane protease YdiL (CAAX protease family)